MMVQITNYYVLKRIGGFLIEREIEPNLKKRQGKGFANKPSLKASAYTVERISAVNCSMV